MPVLSYVDFWGVSLGRADPVTDAFVRSAGPVQAVYSRVIAELKLPAPRAELRLFDRHDSSSAAVRVHVRLGEDSRLDQFDSSLVELPDGIDVLTPAARADLVADVFHSALLGRADARGWDLEALRRARAEVGRRRGDFTLATAWKASPGRRWRARVHYRLDQQSRAWARLEVRPRLTSDKRSWISDQLRASGVDQWDFDRLSTLEWSGPDRAILTVWLGAEPLLVDRCEWVADEQTSWSAAESDNAVPGGLSTPVHEAERSSVAVEIVLHGQGEPEDEPEAWLGSGGPTNHVPEAYLLASHWLSSWVGDHLRDWWPQTGARRWENRWNWSEDPRVPEKLFVRLTGTKLRTEIRHRMPDPAAEAHPVASAHAKMSELIKAVQKRLRLPDPLPPLPPVEQVEAAVGQSLTRRADHFRQMLQFITMVEDRLTPWLTEGLREELSNGNDAFEPLRIRIDNGTLTLTSDEKQRWQEIIHHYT